MFDYNFYKPANKGNLPIRVLKNNFLDRFIRVTPDFFEEFRHEVDYEGLYRDILWVWGDNPVTDIAEITNNREIRIYANYCQMLWGICHTAIVLYFEHLIKVINKSSSSRRINLKNIHINQALNLFMKSIGLLNAFESEVFFDLPNPERYSKFDKLYIEFTNGIFEEAIAFYLLHEFSHQYYGHISNDEDNNSISSLEREKRNKQFEYDADEYALEKMSRNFNSNRKDNFRLGIICSLASLIFIDKNITGGSTHPDPDDRLENVLNKMQIDEKDTIWGVPAMLIESWSVINNIQFKNPLEDHIEPRDWFYIRLKELRDYKAGMK